jgi:hypothetical protein
VSDIEMPNSWIDALKKWNTEKGGPWCVPRKGSPEYEQVSSFMPTKPKKPSKIVKVVKKEPVAEPIAEPTPKRKRPVFKPTDEQRREMNESQMMMAEDRDVPAPVPKKVVKKKRPTVAPVPERQMINEARSSKALTQLREVESQTKTRNEARKREAEERKMMMAEDRNVTASPKVDTKYKNDYDKYVRDLKVRKAQADEYRQMIQDKYKKSKITDANHQLLGMLAVGNIHTTVDDEPILSYDEYSAKRKAQEEYLASAPDRYRNALAKRKKAIEDRYKQVQEWLSNPDLSKVNQVEIPKKKDEMVSKMKQLGIKGVTGSVADLREKLEAYNKSQIDRELNSFKYAEKALRQSLNQVKAYEVLMGLPVEKLQEIMAHIENIKAKNQEKIMKLRMSIPRRASSKEEVEEINKKIADLNAKTRTFNDKYQGIASMVSGAITFKETNKYRYLEISTLSSNIDGDGIPITIEELLKEVY